MKAVKTILVSLMFGLSASAFAAPTGTDAKAPIKSDMKEISELYEKLGKQIGNKKQNASSQVIVQKLIDKSFDAKKQLPPGAETAPVEQKEEIVSKYNTDMQTMISHLEDMKTALNKGDNKEAKSHYEALKPWTSPDHATQYQ